MPRMTLPTAANSWSSAEPRGRRVRRAGVRRAGGRLVVRPFARLAEPRARPDAVRVREPPDVRVAMLAGYRQVPAVSRVTKAPGCACRGGPRLGRARLGAGSGVEGDGVQGGTQPGHPILQLGDGTRHRRVDGEPRLAAEHLGLLLDRGEPGAQLVEHLPARRLDEAGTGPGGTAC